MSSKVEGQARERAGHGMGTLRVATWQSLELPLVNVKDPLARGGA